MLTLLWAGFTVHSHWEAFIQWCLAAQITLHRYLVMYLLQLNNHQYTGGLWLLTGAFFYGVLHAIGRGMGNLSSPRLSTTKVSLLAARVVPFIGSLMQGVSAILFVFILAVGFNGRRRSQHQPLVRRENQRRPDWRVRAIYHLPGAKNPASKAHFLAFLPAAQPRRTLWLRASRRGRRTHRRQLENTPRRDSGDRRPPL